MAETTDRSPAGSNPASDTTSASADDPPMDGLNPCKHLILKTPDILFSVTPQGSNCLHLAAMLSHDKLAEEVWSTSQVINLNDSMNKIISFHMSETENTANTPDQSPDGSNQPSNPSSPSEVEITEDRISANTPDRPMDRQLLKACTQGDLNLFRHLILENPDILSSVTPHGNNCLHIAAMLGHHQFAKEVWLTSPFLFSSTNKDEETPLIAALVAANAPLAFDMLFAASQHLQPDMEGGQPLNEMLLNIDVRKDNALHHALRNDFEDLAVELLNIEPRLSEQVNRTGESPMYMAARKGYTKVVEKLLKINSSADSGPKKSSALYAAVGADHRDIVEQLLKARPELGNQVAEYGLTPLAWSVANNNIHIVKIFLEHHPNLAYIKNGGTDNTYTPFLQAAVGGFVPIAKELISACPDSAYITDKQSSANALHIAVGGEQLAFVDFILRTPQLHRLINQVDIDGDLPLHYAARLCNPEILRSLLSHKGQDYTAHSGRNFNAVDSVMGQNNLMKTIKWNESFTLVSSAIPSGWSILARDEAKETIKKQAIEEVKSLTNRYTSNTSLVAALLATVTFAAAFTLPGGFDNNPSDAGLPIFAKKASFQVFLISDSIAMCSSLAVAFLCVLATWEDLDYLLNYRKITRALMWCAYTATAVAFGTNLFTVMAPKSLWLAIFILVICCILPFFSKIIGDWPKIRLRLIFGRHFRSDLVPDI